MLFNPADHTIECGDNDEFIKLSIPASQLLELLILSKGELVTRDYLLTEVWDKNGLRGSNNNLNQYMSMLRRTLASHGCENLFITIPKIGFRLNTIISIEMRAGPGENVHFSAPHSVQKKNRKERWMIVIAFLCIILPLAGFIILKQFTSHYDIVSSEMVEVAPNCHALYLHKFSDNEKLRAKNQINAMLKELKLKCDAGNTLLFDNVDPIPDDDDYGRTFLSYCHNVGEKTLGNCTDFFYSGWKEHHE
ncbi:winged helix-turn-helix domain-containing protein [Enterobacter huaxiensis]|jgi:DNA-binding winged helix-turn-helix (wHTH) protein|uniref:winged helix-turn-helix domain-containing protein n=1 Tax=Enterobacter huaxiensis TaxID=2494702 RepID=UPI000E7546B9|nr:helix-turn-helix domain-containing protein [Enterobacter huaxiensis]UNC52213.1 helix-turn-helix domain-containing protein [Enterobacter huaxiensis]